MEYTQKEIFARMEEYAESRERNYRELFEPVLVSKSILTTPDNDDDFKEWEFKIGNLIKTMCEDDLGIIYQVLAVVSFKFNDEICDDCGRDPMLIIESIGLKRSIFIEYFENVDMRKYIFDEFYGDELRKMRIYKKALKDLDALVGECESPGIKLNAIKEQLKLAGALKGAAPTIIHAVNSNIDTGDNKTVNNTLNVAELPTMKDPATRKEISEGVVTLEHDISA